MKKLLVLSLLVAVMLTGCKDDNQENPGIELKDYTIAEYSSSGFSSSEELTDSELVDSDEALKKLMQMRMLDDTFRLRHMRCNTMLYKGRLKTLLP